MLVCLESVIVCRQPNGGRRYDMFLFQVLILYWASCCCPSLDVAFVQKFRDRENRVYIVFQKLKKKVLKKILKKEIKKIKNSVGRSGRHNGGQRIGQPHAIGQPTPVFSPIWRQPAPVVRLAGRQPTIGDALMQN